MGQVFNLNFPANSRVRYRAEVEGFVQGVGFRPFVFQLAQRLGLAGMVLNTSFGALVEVEGPAREVELFFQALQHEPPPLASITRLNRALIPTQEQEDFHIESSMVQSGKSALISADVAVCDDCLREMFNPEDRRFRYPFINCTNCGPRYTIIMDVPYDRAQTSMKVFPLCPTCSAEYHDPSNRRFHAQPNACPVCGPKLWLVDAAGRPVLQAAAVTAEPATASPEAEFGSAWSHVPESRPDHQSPFIPDPIALTVTLLNQGFIVAVKGLGGFHLAVDATNDQAIRRLRARKHREEKPLAVMSPHLEAVRHYAYVQPQEEKVLSSSQRPIVLLSARQPSPLAASVAPDNRYLGVMLPYTPLHHLLLPKFLALVMTSGNLTEEPIAIDNDEALLRLAGIADYFLLHNRDIYLRTDDSVVRVHEQQIRHVRRSRGFVPVPVFLKHSLPPVLAVGGELKNTICLTKDNRAFVSQHLGDLENLPTLEFFEKTMAHLKRILDINPRIIAYDRHPEYLSTKWALDQTGLELVGVQHHHAHICSVMAEYGLDGPVIGWSCDGTGYGDDGRLWGGEMLLAWPDRYERLGHLEYQVLPGGAAAIKEPWRMAVSYLRAAFGSQARQLDLDMLRRQNQSQLALLGQVIEKQIRSPLTSSLGRLFDAVAALIGLKDRAAFEGQAAMMLDMCCPEGQFSPYTYDLDEVDGRLIFKPQEVIRQIVADLISGRPPAAISGRFHWTIIQALAEMARRLSVKTGIKTVALSGGCFQNQILAGGLMEKLALTGLEAFLPRQMPANDGGLSLGQAYSVGMRTG